MAITYKVAKCRNPKNPDVDYFKGTAVKTGDYDFEELTDDIALATTVTKGDIMAVLASIKPFITKALLASRRVVLNDLGAFTIGLQGKCYNRETMEGEEFRPSEYIRGHRILFRPEASLKKEIASKLSLNRLVSEVKE